MALLRMPLRIKRSDTSFASPPVFGAGRKTGSDRGGYPTNTLLIVDRLVREEFLIEVSAVAAL
jgi:hypothetical protein